ncbi:hypothetical protein CSA56_03440 [candidate division KSB3 bacterium]|uniref:Uncharacterized protein n=1 Tax=candidate division KSB3 bacterium TaxID=2044937 RepID=A0A2G6KLC4_9BACT|nr:MAG: hypothetical protein CSA56_03440 [candidate division KSB3 bacterium]
MHTPQDAQKQKLLEEKLKTHIQREFNLGEKVIALLKQKKELESNLREHQNAQGKLEEELERMVQSKEEVETKFLQTQKALQERQRKLKTRSRIIVGDEEQSRETLKQLQRKIHELQTELDTGDSQQSEEKKRLMLNIRKLRKKEVLQRQKLRKIVQQRDSIENRLRSVVKKYKHLAGAYHNQKKQHEKLLETLYKEQINREARIELLQDEKQLNEESLLKEIESLKQAKSELEEKLERVEQKVPATSWALDADLLQVIEKQNQYIQELKDKAHQRSTMLRVENDTLRQEMEEMSNSQEKAKWENKMLESSLKDLQEDLAEYIQLKNKFEEVQEEKERFEQLFRRRLQFIENHDVEEQKSARDITVTPDEALDNVQDRQEAQDGPVWQVSQQEEPLENPQGSVSFLNRWFSRNNRFLGWLNMAKPKILLAVFVLIVIVLSVEIYQQIPWRYMRTNSVSEPEEATLDAPEEFSKIEALENGKNVVAGQEGASDRQQHVALEHSDKQPVPKTPVVKVTPRVQHVQQSSDGPVSKKKDPPQSSSRNIPQEHVKTPDAILVQLQAERVQDYFSQTDTPFPTVENNSILRRHQQQKLAALR